MSLEHEVANTRISGTISPAKHPRLAAMVANATAALPDPGSMNFGPQVIALAEAHLAAQEEDAPVLSRAPEAKGASSRPLSSGDEMDEAL